MFVIGGIVRFAIGPADQIFFDGTRFLMKAREFKEMTGLREGMAIKMTQAITIVTAVIVVAFIWWFLNKTRPVSPCGLIRITEPGCCRVSIRPAW